MRKALVQLGADTAEGRRGGKRVETIRGTSDTSHLLRVGELRTLFDVIDDERVVLGLDIVPRSDLERWLRNR